MVFLHLMREEKFLAGVTQFYNKYFNDGNHCICYINKEGRKSLIDNKLSIHQKEVFFKGNYDFLGTKELSDLVEKADRIVIHSMFINPLVTIMLSQRKYVGKIIWIEWGYDLYDWKSKGRFSFFSNYIHNRIREQCRSFVGIFPPDCDFYKREFSKSKANIFYAPYCAANIPAFFSQYSEKSRLEETVKNSEPIHIMIGHSASRVLNHLEVLELIKRFSDANIKLVLPLSYGDQEYAKEVQSEAVRLYGEKAIVLREMMPAEDYFSIIDRVDIAIFNTHRQIGLDNINRLIFSNTKIFMPENNPMYTYFRENGVNIQSINELSSINFSALIQKCEPMDEYKFKIYRDEYCDMAYKVKCWKNVYDNS